MTRETDDTADAIEQSGDAPEPGEATGEANERATEPGPPDEPAGPDDSDGAGRAERAKRALGWAAVAVLALLSLIAVFRFYTSASAAVSMWVAPEYEALFQAGFNLVVLLLAVSAATLLLSRLSE
jgi:hypothetical protein